MKKYDFSIEYQFALAESMTNGMADCRYFLWVPDWTVDAEEKEYFVILNTGDRINEKFKIVYQFKAEYISKKCCFAISKDGKTAVAGYAAKKGVICYDCESGEVLWNNPDIKRIDKVRFNNFDENIIEVLNSKLEFTYLDKQSGQILEPERAKRVRQVINRMRASKNGKYLMTADRLSSKDKANYTVYDTKTKEIKGRFVAQSQINPDTFDITNDGELAVCSAYQKQGVCLIKVSTGEVVWTQEGLTKIESVCFDKTEEKVLVGCQYGGIYFVNTQNGEIETRKSGEELYLNDFGEDILFVSDKIAEFGGHRIECPSFAWRNAIGIKNGVLLLPAGKEGLMLYDYDGNLIWKNNKLTGSIAYLEDEDMVCTFWSEAYSGKVSDGILTIGKIILASAKDGKIVSQIDISESGRAFIHNNKTVVCNTGKMYDISNGSIKEIEKSFEFVVGTALKKSKV